MAYQESLRMNYWLLTPENPSTSLIVYLHSARGKGNTGMEMVETNDLPRLLYDHTITGLNAYILMPQLDRQYQSWLDVEDQLMDLVETTIDTYDIDLNHVALSGYSMGGTATWSLGVNHWDIFHRIMPIAGSIHVQPHSIDALSNGEVWAVVGSNDTVVPPNPSEQMIHELSKTTDDTTISDVDGIDHEQVTLNFFQDNGIEALNWLSFND